MFCCFENKSPNCMVITGLIANAIVLGLMIWGISDIWFQRDGVFTIYLIAFVFICICLIFFIMIFVFLNLNKSGNINFFYYLGKIFCLIIIILSFISFMFILTSFIILLIDYTERESSRAGKYFPTHEWLAIFFSCLFGLICTAIMIFVANILYRVFEESMIAEPYHSNINQSTVVSSISNQPQPLMQPVVQPVMQPVVQPVV